MGWCAKQFSYQTQLRLCLVKLWLTWGFDNIVFDPVYLQIILLNHLDRKLKRYLIIISSFKFVLVIISSQKLIASIALGQTKQLFPAYKKLPA